MWRFRAGRLAWGSARGFQLGLLPALLIACGAVEAERAPILDDECLSCSDGGRPALGGPRASGGGRAGTSGAAGAGVDAADPVGKREGLVQRISGTTFEAQGELSGVSVLLRSETTEAEFELTGARFRIPDEPSEAVISCRPQSADDLDRYLPTVRSVTADDVEFTLGLVERADFEQRLAQSFRSVVPQTTQAGAQAFLRVTRDGQPFPQVRIAGAGGVPAYDINGVFSDTVTETGAQGLALMVNLDPTGESALTVELPDGESHDVVIYTRAGLLTLVDLEF